MCSENTHAEVQNNFIEIPLQHGSSPGNLLHIFRTPFYKNTSGGLLLFIMAWAVEKFFLKPNCLRKRIFYSVKNFINLPSILSILDRREMGL